MFAEYDILTTYICKYAEVGLKSEEKKIKFLDEILKIASSYI